MRQSLASQGVANLEAVELGLREALFKDGRVLLEQLYNQTDLPVADNASRPGEKCHPGRTKEIHTLFGPIQVSRNYFYRPETDTGRWPLDQALGLPRVGAGAGPAGVDQDGWRRLVLASGKVELVLSLINRSY